MLRDPFAVAAVLVGITALAYWLEERVVWAKRVGASLLVIAFGALLSNLDLVPGSSPVYDAVTGPITSLAIVWLLLAVDLRDLRSAGPRMLGAFALAALATAVGALVATVLMASAIGPEAWKLGGVLTGTYSGGSLNFVSVGRALDLESSVYAAAQAADNLVTGLWMGATLLLPALIGRWFAKPRVDVADSGNAEDHPFFATVPLRPLHLLLLTSLGFALMLASEVIGARVPGVPTVVWLTSLALLVGQAPPIRRLQGAAPLGLIALNLFLGVIGIYSRLGDIAAVGFQILGVTVLTVLIHGLVLYGGALLARIDVETASVASQAAVGGPSSAMALVAGKGWTHLALPGIAVGLLGYAVGTYAGLAVAYLLRSLIG